MWSSRQMGCWRPQMGVAYFPMAAGKVQKCWVPWKRASQRQGLMLGELTGPHHPTSTKRSTAVACPSSKQDQQQPQLHPSICVFPVPKPESALQAGWAQFPHERSQSLSCTFDFNFSCLWNREKCRKLSVRPGGVWMFAWLASF